MVERGIDLLLVTSPENMNYLVGYDAWSFYTHQVAMVSLETELPIWVGRGIDLPCAKYTAILPDANLIGYPDAFVQASDRHEMAFVAEVIESHGWSTQRIGTESDSYYFTARCLDVLRTALPDAKFSDATGLVNWVRIVKSHRELELIREAGEIADSAMAAAYDAISPGVRQCDAAAAILYRQAAGTPRFGGDVPGGVVIASGDRVDAPHLAWTEEPFMAGEQSNLELGGCRRRYHAGLARSLMLGAPGASQVDLAKVVVDAMGTTLGAVAPGRVSEDIYAVWDREISRRGYSKSSRIGYSIGLGYPPDWGEHTLSVRPGDRTELQSGMVLHLIFGMWAQPTSFVISETIEVTETGHASVSRFPRELLVKTA